MIITVRHKRSEMQAKTIFVEKKRKINIKATLLQKHYYSRI
jgi:hypothetical protein